MIISAWNVRGFNQPLKHLRVQRLSKDSNIDVLALLETKLSKNVVNKIVDRKFYGWSWYSNHASHHAGRILILWKSSMKVQILHSTAQVVHCSIQCKLSNKVFDATFVYGLHSIADRKPLWLSISQIAANVTGPWLLLGDYNCVLSPMERSSTNTSNYDISDFADCCLQLGLENLNTTGEFYTWSNGTIWSKIDRALCNNAWHYSFPTSFCLVPGLESTSDHAPLIVHTELATPPPKFSFRFNNAWVESGKFLDCIRCAWAQPLYGCHMYVLCKRLMKLKPMLRNLAKESFSNLSRKVKLAEEEYKDVLNNLVLTPRDSVIKKHLFETRSKVLQLRKAEALHLNQLAKNKFLLLADRGTNYFHDYIKRRKHKNLIASIILDNGHVASTPTQVATCFVQHFQKLFSANLSQSNPDASVIDEGQRIKKESWSSLIRPVTKEDVWNVVKTMGNLKAPGPDGYNAFFFKHAWDIIGNDVYLAVNEFFSTGQLLKQVNHGLISLIPKVEQPSTIGHFRPITCCNVVYKIISKLLANRINEVLDELISPEQSAFVRHRKMKENIMLVQELLRKYNRKRVTPRCMMKIDLFKAYDTVSWSFLQWMLSQLDFPPRFICWIMECITTPSFSVLLNGSIHGHFRSGRGLRQGDPLSPYLFVICMEYLSRDLKRLDRSITFQYHPSCNPIKLVHLAFADDLMLFARGDIPSVAALCNKLQHFSKITGLAINKEKSELFVAGVDGPELQLMESKSGFKLGTMPFRYLGVPLQSSRLCSAQFAPLVDKCMDLIKGWNSKNLSYAGRTELIRAVLQGVATFWMGIFPLPAVVLKRIISLCRNFLWCKSPLVNSRPLVAWREACLPKNQGGLGLISLPAWNLAALAKTLWELQRDKNSLWIKWLHSYYLKGKSVWDYKPKNGDSHWLKCIFRIRDLLISLFGDPNSAVTQMQTWFIDDVFQVQKPYLLFLQVHPKAHWHSIVWKHSTPPKMAFVFWLAVKGRLLTLDRTPYLQLGPFCPLCKHQTENHQHLFFSCGFSFKVWCSIRDWVQFSHRSTSLKATLDRVGRGRRASGRWGKLRCLSIAATVYIIWRTRNAFLFDSFVCNVNDVIFKIKTIILRYASLEHLI